MDPAPPDSAGNVSLIKLDAIEKNWALRTSLVQAIPKDMISEGFTELSDSVINALYNLFELSEPSSYPCFTRAMDMARGGMIDRLKDATNSEPRFLTKEDVEYAILQLEKEATTQIEQVWNLKRAYRIVPRAMRPPSRSIAFYTWYHAILPMLKQLAGMQTPKADLREMLLRQWRSRPRWTSEFQYLQVAEIRGVLDERQEAFDFLQVPMRYTQLETYASDSEDSVISDGYGHQESHDVVDLTGSADDETEDRQPSRIRAQNRPNGLKGKSKQSQKNGSQRQTIRAPQLTAGAEPRPSILVQGPDDGVQAGGDGVAPKPTAGSEPRPLTLAQNPNGGVQAEGGGIMLPREENVQEPALSDQVPGAPPGDASTAVRPLGTLVHPSGRAEKGRPKTRSHRTEPHARSRAGPSHRPRRVVTLANENGDDNIGQEKEEAEYHLNFVKPLPVPEYCTQAEKHVLYDIQMDIATQKRQIEAHGADELFFEGTRLALLYKQKLEEFKEN